MRVERWKRASASNPGKHGPEDWRVTFNGTAPKHSEVIFMLGMLLIAEDRYKKWGRTLLWHFIDQLLMAKTPEQVIAIAEDAEDSVSGGTGFMEAA